MTMSRQFNKKIHVFNYRDEDDDDDRRWFNNEFVSKIKSGFHGGIFWRM